LLAQSLRTSLLILSGVYALCLGNNMSKYSRKLVHIYFQTQLATDWHNYTSAIVEYQTELLNMTVRMVTAFRLSVCLFVCLSFFLSVVHVLF